ncbi:MAG: LysM peptidoglycan-binding domain-containing protein [Parafilimonas sp.]
MLYAKKFIVLVVCIFSLQLLSAQSKYITHTLKQGESLSMLAKQYNTSVGDIMRINGMHADTKLVYGSQIKIPSVKGEALTTAKKETSNIPNKQPTTSSNEITHVVMKGETLYSISKKYNVSVDQLKAWNHLTDDNTKVGTLLAISDNGINKIATPPVPKQRVETTTAPAQQPITPAINNSQDLKTEPVNANVEKTKTDDQKTVTQPAAQTENNVANVATTSTNTDYKGAGYFADQFKNKSSNRNIPGVSKTFKTASGWTDGKFYILANDIEPGTIVKITADNGNSVYAKVLWNLGDMKENSGINFRVSDATAAALHENSDSFNVSVSF